MSKKSDKSPRELSKLCEMACIFNIMLLPRVSTTAGKCPEAKAATITLKPKAATEDGRNRWKTRCFGGSGARAVYPHRACYGGAPRCFPLLFVAFLLQVSEIRQQFCWIRGGPCRARSPRPLVLHLWNLSNFQEICQNSLHVYWISKKFPITSLHVNFQEIRQISLHISTNF